MYVAMRLHNFSIDKDGLSNFNDFYCTYELKKASAVFWAWCKIESDLRMKHNLIVAGVISKLVRCAGHFWFGTSIWHSANF